MAAAVKDTSTARYLFLGTRQVAFLSFTYTALPGQVLTYVMAVHTTNLPVSTDDTPSWHGAQVAQRAGHHVSLVCETSHQLPSAFADLRVPVLSLRGRQAILFSSPLLTSCVFFLIFWEASSR